LTRAARLDERVKNRIKRALGRPVAQEQPDPRVDRLVRSELFDEAWYADQVDDQTRFADRAAAVRHYLDEGLEQGLSPHPLVDPEHIRRSFNPRRRERLGKRDPLSLVLRRKLFEVSTHPLFDAVGYAERFPESLDHPDGPTGHYCSHGGVGRPNDWLPAGVDLRDWVRDRTAEWHVRAAVVPVEWRDAYDLAAAERVAERWRTAPAPTTTVGVLLNPGSDEDVLTATLDSLAAQSHAPETVVVLDLGRLPGLPKLLEDRLPGRHRVVTGASLGEALQRSAEGIGTDFVAWLQAGDRWEPDRLRVLTAAAASEAADVVVDDLADQSPAERGFSVDVPAELVPGRVLVDPARVLVRRSALPKIDTTLRGAWLFDVLVRLRLGPARWSHVGWAGVRRTVADPDAVLRAPEPDRPLVDHEFLDSWKDVSLGRRLVDWVALSEREQRDVVSVIIPTYDDSALTTAAVESVMASDGVGGVRLECLVWDNGSSASVSPALDALVERFPDLVLLRTPVNLGFSLGNDLALAQASGSTVVFLNNDTTVPAGWLPPLLEALDQPGVLAVQPLLLYPSGSVQCAGVVHPTTGGLPSPLLQGFPVEDAAGVDALELAALTGAALVMRYADAVALRGFDPVFTNGMEDIDLCHRLRALRPGHFRVVSGVRVVHHESRTPGRFARHLVNRDVYLDRWRGVDEPRDDVRMWAACGYTVVGHEVRHASGPAGRRLGVPEPVLVRTARLEVKERPRSLRWAIKHAAPAGEVGETWGDTHFARALADALRQRGQEVVIDHREEFERASGRHDDVVLVLRGLRALRTSPEFATLAWVISHPDLVTRAELEAYDHVFAASTTWSHARSRAWGVPIEPLLQATDPVRFHPERGTPGTGHDVLFVGNSRNVNRPVVRDAVAAGLPLKIFGSDWGQFVPADLIAGEYIDNEHLATAYRSAGVVLNDHWEDMARDGFLSNRLFDAVACGARVITDEVAGGSETLREIFGDAVQIYRGVEDLHRLAEADDAVFGDDATRLAVAAGVAVEHSFGARADRLIEVAHEVCGRRGLDGRPAR
jgi:GT2 family glycosyltransferase